MSTDNIEAFKFTLKDLREKMTKLLKMCESTDLKLTDANDVLYDGLINIMDIKYLNAEVQKEVEGYKENINKEKEKVEEKNLYFQNFLYQKEHIVSQVNACKNHPTPEMDIIHFPSETEVRAYFNIPDGQELTKTDYLNYELESRKKLNEKVGALNKEKDENLSTYRDTQMFFKELPNYLGALENSSLRSQKYLNVKITETEKLLNLSTKLPPPLYVLYNSLNCTSLSEFEYTINILGNEAQVNEFYSKYRIDNIDLDKELVPVDDAREEGEHSDHEFEPEKKESKKRNKKKEKSNSLGRITKFPLYVQLSITGCNDGDRNLDTLPVSINFYYIPVFNVITCEAVHSKGIYNTSHFLSNIFTKLVNFDPNENQAIEHAISKFSITDP
jgi:hypothetical protein